MSELVTREGEVIDTSSYIIQTATSLDFRKDTPEEVWQAVVRKLLSSREALNWWIGDAILQGEARYGEKYSQELQEATSMSYSTLSNLVYVSRSVSAENRRRDLSHSHHAEVAGLPPEEQRSLLQEAAPEPGNARARISRDQLRIRVRNNKRIKSIEAGQSPPPVTVDDLSFSEMRGLASARLEESGAAAITEDGEVVDAEEVIEEEGGLCPTCHGSGRL